MGDLDHIEEYESEIRTMRIRLNVLNAEYAKLFDASHTAYMALSQMYEEAKAIILATYYAPEEGTDIPVFRVPSKEMDAKIVRFLLDHGAERYVPKEKRK